jgi:hypothetical protein
MKIKTITDQSRRDFWCVYECEGCGRTKKGGGYDDANFHQNVIPNMKCEGCGKSAVELGADVRPLAPKYPADAVI